MANKNYTIAVARGGRWEHDWIKRGSLSAAIEYAKRQLRWHGPNALRVQHKPSGKTWLVDRGGVNRVATDHSAEGIVYGHG